MRVGQCIPMAIMEGSPPANKTEHTIIWSVTFICDLSAIHEYMVQRALSIGCEPLKTEWQDFFKSTIFPLLFVPCGGATTSTSVESVPGGKKRRTPSMTRMESIDKPVNSQIDSSVYEIKDAYERLEMFQFHLSVHTRMPVKISEVSQLVIKEIDAGAHQMLCIGALDAASNESADFSQHPWNHIMWFDASHFFPNQLQRDLNDLLEKRGVHDYNERKKEGWLEPPPTNQLSMIPIWSASYLKKGERHENQWTDVYTTAEYGFNRLHVPHDSLQAYADQHATSDEKSVLQATMAAIDHVYTRVYDRLHKRDANSGDVTNTATKHLISILVSRNLSKVDYDKLAKGHYKWRKATSGKKFYQWKEPKTGTAVQGTDAQPSHMDVRDASGTNIIIAMHRAQPLDVVPDSALGIKILTEEIIPLYDRAIQYFDKELYPAWSQYNAGKSLECGRATFYSYIVDRRFKLRGVKPLWPRYTLMIEPGHGVAIRNKMLHAGAKYSGPAAHRIHIYMTEQGLLLPNIGEPEVSDVVYDFRTDPQMFVLARYLHAEGSETINMTA